MKYLAWLFSLFCLVHSLVWADGPSVNRFQANAPEKVAAVEQVIREQLALLKSDTISDRPMIAQTYAVPIRNPFSQLSQSTYQTFDQYGINLKAMSRYKALYVAGTLAGTSAVKIINTDPETVLVVGTGSVSHEGIYSRGPVVIVGTAHLMAEVYGKSLVWYGELASTTGVDKNIGLPVVTSSQGGKDSLGISPYSAKEEIVALRQLKTKTHFDSATQYGKAISNPFKRLTPTQTQALKQQGLDIERLSHYKTLVLEQQDGVYFGSILNTDPNILLVLTTPVDVYSLGPVVVNMKEYGPPNTLLSDDFLWVMTGDSASIYSDWRGRPLGIGNIK